jgi:hypothetical protein
MPTALSAIANERSSYFVTVTLIDEAGITVPTNHVTSVTYTLTNSSGDVINGLSKIVPATVPLTNPFLVILTGNDLQIEGGTDEIRHLTIEAVYDSDLGTSLHFTDYVTFTLRNLVAIEGTVPSASPSPSASASPSPAVP